MAEAKIATMSLAMTTASMAVPVSRTMTVTMTFIVAVTMPLVMTMTVTLMVVRTGYTNSYARHRKLSAVVFSRLYLCCFLECIQIFVPIQNYGSEEMVRAREFE